LNLGIDFDLTANSNRLWLN